MKDNILVKDPKHLTMDWAQSVLQLHDANGTVSSLKVITIHSGTTTRVQLAVNHDSQHVARKWFVKLPSRTWQARVITALPRLLKTEALFYKQLSRIVPLNLATCLAARSQWGSGTIIVLADVSEQGGVAGIPGDVLKIQQAYVAVEQLARFHAFFWQDKTLKTKYPWIADSVLGSALSVPLMQRGLQKAGNWVDQKLYEPALQYAKNRKKVMAFLNDAPQTLTHHDCHAGNLFWKQDGSVGFLDWQLVRLGDGIGDVAYLLTTTLTPELRRQHESDLITLYSEVLSAYGITLHSEELMLRYRAHCCYTFEAMVVTLAIGGMMDSTTNLELIRRTSVAIMDLNSFAALPLT
ncbi:MAG: phosphotransferase [Deltaproteobacteria bacterium]|nr:phosphotransferase [Deltaproteobacteria bacterium]